MTTRNVIIQPYEVPGGTTTTEVAISFELVDADGAPQLGYDEVLGDGVAGAYATTVRDTAVTVPLQLTTELVPPLYWRFKAQWGSLTGYRSYTSELTTLGPGGDLALSEFLDLGTTPTISAISIQSGNYTLLSTDSVVIFTATATATLPAAVGSGQTYRIVCRAGTLTIDPDGTETVKGETTSALSAGEDLILTDTAMGVWE